MIRSSRWLALSMGSLLVAGLAGAGTVVAQSDTTITVRSLWGGAEQEAFQKVLDAFKAKTGITATYESVRDNYESTLRTDMAGGNPPDVTVVPGIGFLRSFARDGSIVKIADLGLDPAALAGNYPPGLLDVGVVDGDLYALPVKFNSKSTFWYRPDEFAKYNMQTPADWPAFTKLLADIKAGGMAPLGLGAKDSWTLTDWFESIYIRMAGPDKYDQLFSGALPWTDQSVTDAITAMTSVLTEDYVAGGITAALGRGFVDGIGEIYSAAPDAELYYEGGFVGGIATGQVNTALVIGTTIDWFPFPTINGGDGVTIGGDVIAALTTNPGVKEFIDYMTTPESGQVWAATGAIISPVKGVDTSVYPNALVTKEADQVANASAVRFDGSDLLPVGMGDKLGAVLQDAIQGKDLAPLLAGLEEQVKAAWEAE